SFVFGRVGDHPYDPRGFAEEVLTQFDALAQGRAGRVCVVSRAADVRAGARAALPGDWERIIPPPGLDRAAMLDALYGDAAAFVALETEVPAAVFARLQAFRTSCWSAAAASRARANGPCPAAISIRTRNWSTAPCANCARRPAWGCP